MQVIRLEQGEKGKEAAMRPRARGRWLVAFAMRHAWLGFIAIGVLGLAFGAILYATAQPPELETFERVTGISWAEAQQSLPGMAEYVSITLLSEAQFLLAFSVFLIALAVVPYRKGERWAWYGLWVVPILLVTLGLRVFLAGGMGWTLIAAQLVIALGALLLPYRLFFPHGKEKGTAESGQVSMKGA